MAKKKTKYTPPAPKRKVREAIRNLIEYGWADELDDYLENQTKGHVFTDLVRVSNWLDGLNGRPEALAKDARASIRAEEERRQKRAEEATSAEAKRPFTCGIDESGN